MTSTTRRRPARGSAPSMRDRARDDPAVDRRHQVEALGDGEEGGGRDQLAVGAAHAQQQLVLGRLAGREVDDRLGVQHEAVLGQRVADHVRPRDARLDAGLGLLRPVIGGHASFARYRS